MSVTNQDISQKKHFLSNIGIIFEAKYLMTKSDFLEKKKLSDYFSCTAFYTRRLKVSWVNYYIVVVNFHNTNKFV